MSRIKLNSGFTATEWLITILILAAMAGIVVPVVISEQKRVHAERALEQLNRISEPVFQCLRDSRPQILAGEQDLLVGVGALDSELNLRKAGDLLDWLSLNTTSPRLLIQGQWKGPYRTHLEPDPWGQAYLLLGLREEDPHTWLISPGQNGVLETKSSDLSLGGDDFGVRLR